MDAYYPYNPDSTQAVQEATTLTSTTLQLRYIPKEASVRIMGFVETNSLVVSQGHFRVDYFGASGDYRDSSRCIYFNEADIGRDVNVEYVAVGTPVTAADMNEIKLHMENSNLHGGGTHPITPAQVQQFVDHMNNASIHGGGGSASVSVATRSKAGIVKPGSGLGIFNDGTLYLDGEYDPTDRRIDSNIHFYGKTESLWEGENTHGDLIYVTSEQRFYIWNGDSGEWLPFNSGGGAGTSNSKTLTGPDISGGGNTWDWVWAGSGEAGSTIWIPDELYNNSTVSIHNDTQNCDIIKIPGYDYDYMDDPERGNYWWFNDDGYNKTIEIYNVYFDTTITISWRS